MDEHVNTCFNCSLIHQYSISQRRSKKGGAGAPSPIQIQVTGNMSILCHNEGRKKKKEERGKSFPFDTLEAEI